MLDWKRQLVLCAILFVGTVARSRAQESVEPSRVAESASRTSIPFVAGTEDRNGDLLSNDRLLMGDSVIGWFAAIETDLVAAHVGNRLIGSVNIGGGTNTIQVPSTPLGWTAMPRLDFGYRLGQGAGELLVSYRATATSGSRSIAANDFATIRSRFQTHQADFAYASREDWALPGWVLRWQAGARLASVFFDSQGRGVSQVERVANEFIGVGPQFGLEMRRPTNIAGLSPFIRLDAAWVVGRIEQTFQESTNTSDSAGVAIASRRLRCADLPSLRS